MNIEEHMQLYVKFYEDDSLDKRLVIYRGVYNANSIYNSRPYPVVKIIGNINITHRYFIKFAKFSQKIINQDGNTLILNGHDNYCTEIHNLTEQHGIDIQIINDIIEIVNNISYNKRFPIDIIFRF